MLVTGLHIYPLKSGRGVAVEEAGGEPGDGANNAHLLAALAGQLERGEALLGRIDRALASTRQAGPRFEVLLWQRGGLVPGEGTLIAQLLAHTGFASHSAARGLGQGAYLPLEQVLADPPQVIIAAGGERMLTHPALRRLEGVEYQQLDPSLLFCGGPSVIRAVERLAEIRAGISLPLAEGVRGGPERMGQEGPPPAPPPSGSGVS